jgi:hypothetical protein
VATDPHLHAVLLDFGVSFCAAVDNMLSGVNAPVSATDDACEDICGVSCDGSLSRSGALDDAEDCRNNAESED